MAKEEVVPVEINGRVYHLRSNQNPEYVQGLARLVDEKMNHVARHTKTIDSVRVAVLAALNLADDYCILKKDYEQRIRDLEGERTKLLNLVESALKEETPITLPDS